MHFLRGDARSICAISRVRVPLLRTCERRSQERAVTSRRLRRSIDGERATSPRCPKTTHTRWWSSVRQGTAVWSCECTASDRTVSRRLWTTQSSARRCPSNGAAVAPRCCAAKRRRRGPHISPRRVFASFRALVAGTNSNSRTGPDESPDLSLLIYLRENIQKSRGWAGNSRPAEICATLPASAATILDEAELAERRFHLRGMEVLGLPYRVGAEFHGTLGRRGVRFGGVENHRGTVRVGHSRDCVEAVRRIRHVRPRDDDVVRIPLDKVDGREGTVERHHVKSEGHDNFMRTNPDLRMSFDEKTLGHVCFPFP